MREGGNYSYFFHICCLGKNLFMEFSIKGYLQLRATIFSSTKKVHPEVK